METKIVKTNSIKIALHLDSHTNREGKNQIYLRIYNSGKYTCIRTGKSVAPKFWDKQGKAVRNVKGNHGATRMIADLDEQKAKLRRIIDDLVREGKVLTRKRLETLLFQTDQSAVAVTLEEVFQRSLAEDRLDPDVSEKSIGHYAMIYKDISRFFPGKLIQDFCRQDIEAIRAHWTYDRQLARKTVYNYLSILKKPLLKATRKWGLIDQSPFEGLKLRKVQYSQREFLTGEELSLLHKLYLSGELEDKFIHNNCKFSMQEVLQFFLAGCYTGLRYNDLRKINDRSTYFVGDVIRIQQGKTKNWVTIPILPQLREIICPFGEKVFDKVQDSNRTTTYNTHLRAVLDYAGIKRHFSAHCSRHTFACVALEVGISMEVIQAILGHSDIRVTQIYAKIQGKTVMEEMAKFGKLSEMGRKRVFRRVV